MTSIIVGVPGVGKSTIVNEVIKRQNLKRLVWGDIVEQIAFEKRLIKNRDSIRKLSKSVQKTLQKLVVERLKLLSKGGDAVIETHALIKTKSGFLPGLNLEFLEILKPDLFVVIEAGACDILKRRKKDRTRKRDDDKSCDEIQLHMELTRQFAITFSSIVGASFFIIKNEEGKVHDAVSQLQNIMKNI